MANIIKCPNCGENNTADHEFCKYCQARLQPLTGPLKGADRPITPGDTPTKKTTSELEPMLPQWLREARDTARQSGMDEPLAPKQRPAPSASEPDLLAGLRSQAGDDSDDDTPDWLANITGVTPKAKKPDNEPAGVRWVELGGKDEFPQESSSANDTPDWLANIQSSSSAPSPEKDDVADWFRQAASGIEAQPASGNDSDWLNQLSASQGFADETPESQQSTSDTFGDAPDWLKPSTKGDSKSNPPAWLQTGELKESDASIEETPNWLNPAQQESQIFGDTPDWLKSLGNEQQEQPKEESASSFGDTPDWLKSMSGGQTQQEPASFDDTPDWLKSMGGTEQSQPAFNATPANDDADWLKSLGAEQPVQQQQESASFDDTPDWLKSMSGAEESQPTFNAAPANDDADWLKSLGAEQPPQPQQESSPFGDTPDWLKSMGSEQSRQESASSDETPNWLKSMGSMEENQSAFDVAPANDDADWLKSLGAEQPVQQQQESAPFGGDTPDWLNQMGAGESQSGGFAAFGESSFGGAEAANDMPDWIGGLPAQQPESTPAAAEPSNENLGDLPDWLKSAAPQSSVFSEPPAENVSSNKSEWERTFSSQTPAEQTPAFSGDLGGADLFTEMPDWLSTAKEEQTPAFISDTTSAEPALSQGDLPSWVQAMRPIDTGVPAATASDQTLEQRGALAGLQGVLPAVPGYAPSSKPKAYSIKLQAGEEQQSHAALLEQILAAEGEVTPVASFTPLAASRGLRWTIAFVLFAIVFFVTFLRTTIFSMPVGMPFDLNGAIQVSQSLPAGAPVLIAMDYEPARAGEMEAAAAPMLDQIILLKQSRLTFIATSDKGGALAERLISGPLAVHNYQSRNQYLNLGYLPGGVIGVRAFAQNPQQTMPFDVNQFRAWDSTPVQGVTALSNYAALIIIADDIDAVRAWLEQTQSLRGSMPVVVITSAQAAPMVQPYYASGQIQGMVGGLYGAALFEQSNAGRPGTARAYWDAYSIGSLLAVVFILVGGLWNFGLGLRERSAKQDNE